MQLQWIDFDIPFIRGRYNRVAKSFIFFEWLFLLPTVIRRKTVSRLELKSVDLVLVLGC
jgi:hypothetical protein